MNNGARSFDPSYFDRLYTQKSDPWDLATSEYERHKYAATLAALGGRHFHSVFEIGCSIGILTRRLAPFCDSLLAVDVAEAALDEARRNCAAMTQAVIQRMHIPHDWPSSTFDLILFSEVLYFLDPDDIARAADRSITTLKQDGLVLLVHWTGETDYPCGGDEAVEHYLVACGGGLRPVAHQRQPQYRLDLLARA